MTRGASKDAMVSVLVPVTAPAPELLEVYAELCEQLDAIGVGYEIIYLCQRSAHLAEERKRVLELRGRQNVRIIDFVHGGEAAMLAAGAGLCRGDVVFTVSPQFEIDLTSLSSLYSSVIDGADVAFAMRMRGESGRSVRLQSQLFNKLVSWVAGTRFHDVASGTRAIRKPVFDEIPLYGDFHRYLPVLADRLGFRVQEIPTPQHPRVEAPLFYSPVMYLWRAIDVLSVLFISRFTRAPLRLFGVVGAAFAAIGLVILVVIATERVFGTPLANRPVLALAILLIGLGVQSFTIGLLGELLLFFNARSIRDYRIAAVYEAADPPLQRREPSGSRITGSNPAPSAGPDEQSPEAPPIRRRT